MNRHIRHLNLILLSCFLILISSPAFAKQMVIQTGVEKTGTLVFESSPLLSMTEIPFRITLSDSKEVVSATCDLTMPAMPMPENRPALDCTDSTCTGTAIFTMAGAWRAACEFIMLDGTSKTLIFDIEMVKMK